MCQDSASLLISLMHSLQRRESKRSKKLKIKREHFRNSSVSAWSVSLILTRAAHHLYLRFRCMIEQWAGEADLPLYRREKTKLPRKLPSPTKSANHLTFLHTRV